MDMTLLIESLQMPASFMAIPFKGLFLFLLLVVFSASIWIFEFEHPEKFVRGSAGAFILPVVYGLTMLLAVYSTIQYGNFGWLMVAITPGLLLFAAFDQVQRVRARAS